MTKTLQLLIVRPHQSSIEIQRESKTVQLAEVVRRTLDYAKSLLALANEAKEAVKQLPYA